VRSGRQFLFSSERRVKTAQRDVIAKLHQNPRASVSAGLALVLILVLNGALLVSAESVADQPATQEQAVRPDPMSKQPATISGLSKPVKTLALRPSMTDPDTGYRQDAAGITANPGAVNVLMGTGRLGRLLGLKDDSGIRLGGLWIGNADLVMTGGAKPGTGTFNSLGIIDLQLDLTRLQGIPGASVGTSFLQFNGQDSNGQAGVLTGYNGLTETPPLNRSELYQLWWRQTLFDDTLVVRIGKSIATYDFNNVIRALPIAGEVPYIPAVSGLLYTPIFVNPSILGVMPGYYNSAWGITTTIAPTPSVYASYGIYDGSLARGRQTGIAAWPTFSGYYFNIAEIGYSWTGTLPGKVAIGGWHQSGVLKQGNIQENGAQGFYALGSNRLWTLNEHDGAGAIIGFLQYGINNSKTMLVNQFVGGGLTGFGLIPHRPKDSVGLGIAVSWLNNPPRSSNNEIIAQIYYQAHLIGDIFFQPTFTYVPHPGMITPENGSYSAATALVFQFISLF
jgi:porin